MRKDFRIAESIETLQNQGPATITTEDLLAIIIGNREKAAKLLHQDATLFTGQKDGLTVIAEEDYDGLKYRAGLSKIEASRLTACIELSKRIAHAPATDMDHITSPGDAAAYLMKNLRYETHECFYVMMLNCKNRIIRVKKISEGSLSSSVVSIQKVFAAAITANASSILVGHNHPSQVYPIRQSAEDEALTHALEAAGQVLSIPLLDHVIISGKNYFSFKEKGLI